MLHMHILTYFTMEKVQDPGSKPLLKHVMLATMASFYK